MARVHLVYAHPSERGFTREIRDAFVAGLERAGHTYSISDLYAMDFRSELSLAEYERESAYLADGPVPDDVAAEQAKLNAADVWAFVYPVWWTDCPARMKGWFDRVWTVGFSHKPARPRRADKAIVLCTAGYTAEQLESNGCYQAMKTVMLYDRIGTKRGTRSSWCSAARSCAPPRNRTRPSSGRSSKAVTWLTPRHAPRRSDRLGGDRIR